MAGTGTSIFDPVLCELVYRWFCPPGGLVLDPLAGGSVRGIVASRLGRRYVVIELRAEQVRANDAQAKAMCGAPLPRWQVGDARDFRADGPGDLSAVAADLVFTCPPYADLEVYSDDPRDLSTMPYDAFRAAWAGIVAQSVAALRADRFAVVVVGDVRAPGGQYRAFPWHTVAAFEAAGAALYNEAVLVTAVGSLPVRTAKPFVGSRKLGKTHQNCLVFIKGSPTRATEACGAVDVADVLAGVASP